MNILYITHLTGQLSDGPCYSVPEQIKAQSRYDHVFWWNLTPPVLDHWVETGLFHGVGEFPNKAIRFLPQPFDCPNLVVFEDFYYADDVFHAYECRKRHIPYVIVPRGALTHQGQSQKHVKKAIANLFAFRPMVQHAAAIQYLTEHERLDSGEAWNKHWFIEPNGIYPSMNEYKDYEIPEVINGTYIGRFDLYHKGLDLLYSAVLKLKAELRKSRIVITLYGPECEGQKASFIDFIKKQQIQDILVVKDGVFGEDKKRILQNSDFFIMTSRYEGMPMSLIEAMSYGLPCVASRGTNLSDIVKTYKAGWVCENTEESIVDALQRLCEERNHFAQYGRNAYKLSLEYNWDSIAARTHDYYQTIGGATK